MAVTPDDLAVARALPGLPEALAYFRAWRLVSMRTVNKTGSRIQVKLGMGQLRREFRLTVSYLLKEDNGEFLGPGWAFANAFWGAFSTGAPDILREFQCYGIKEPPYRHNGNEVLLELFLLELPSIREVYAKALEMARGGEPLRRQRLHARTMAMACAKAALQRAFANGTTREEVNEMLDLLLVEEVMSR